MTDITTAEVVHITEPGTDGMAGYCGARIPDWEAQKGRAASCFECMNRQSNARARWARQTAVLHRRRAAEAHAVELLDMVEMIAKGGAKADDPEMWIQVETLISTIHTESDK